MNFTYIILPFYCRKLKKACTFCMNFSLYNNKNNREVNATKTTKYQKLKKSCQNNVPFLNYHRNTKRNTPASIVVTHAPTVLDICHTSSKNYWQNKHTKFIHGFTPTV